MAEQLDPNVVAMMKALSQHESGNKAVLPQEKGIGGASIYQYTTSTWKKVAQKYLGDANAPLNRANENKATYYQIKEWKDKGFKPAQIASMWNAGEGEPDAYTGKFSNGKPSVSVNSYGVKYDVPAHAKSVLAKFQAEVAKIPKPAAAPVQAQTAVEQPKPEEPGFLQRAGDIAQKRAGNVKQSFLRSEKPLTTGGAGQSPVETGLQTVGQAVAGAGEIAFEAAKSLVPDWLKNKAKENVQNFNKNLNPEAKAQLDKSIENGLELAAQGAEKYESWKKENPRAAANLEATVNIASIFPTGRAGKAALTEANALKSTGKEFLSKAAEQAIKEDSESVVKNAVKNAIEKGIKPSSVGKKTTADFDAYYTKAGEAFNSIAKRKPAITDEATGELVSRAPQNRKELLESIANAKKSVFDEYHQKAVAAGEAGARFDLTPVVEKLAEVANPKNTKYNPQIRKYADDLFTELSELNNATPDVIEERIKDLNSSLQGFYEGRVSKAKAQLDASVANLMRKELDQSIEKTAGPGYQTLKNEYGALKSIEKDVARQVAVEARKNSAGLVDFTDIFTGGDIMAGVIAQNPALIAKGVAGKAVKSYIKYLNDPNRYIKNVFEVIENPTGGFLKKSVSATKGVAKDTAQGAYRRAGLVIEDVSKKADSDLLKEAKKYKTAEEFVKAQGTPVYHGGAANIKEVNPLKGQFSKTFYVSDNADYAKSYGGKNSSLNEIWIDPNANLADMRNTSEKLVSLIQQAIKGRATGKTFNIKKPDGTFISVPEILDQTSFGPFSQEQVIQGIRDGKAHFAELPEIKKVLQKLGYDGQITSEVPYAKNIGVWNKDVIKTKSQLTDIWNKANKKFLSKEK